MVVITIANVPEVMRRLRERFAKVDVMGETQRPFTPREGTTTISTRGSSSISPGCAPGAFPIFTRLSAGNMSFGIS